MKKMIFIKSKKFVRYAKKILVLIKVIKRHLDYIIKSEIIVIILENIKELLIIFVIVDIEHQKNSGSTS